MKKRKVVIFVIPALCIVIFAGAFLILRSWFHSDGMHFIGRYGQVHMSQICEGFDQDGNKIEARNVIVDGVITMTESKDLGKFSGTIDIVDLPELDGLVSVKVASARKYDNGLYRMEPCLFRGFSHMDLDSSEQYDENSEQEDWNSGSAWIKDNQIVMEFYVGGTIPSEKYYIFYSDEEMLNIEELNYKQ